MTALGWILFSTLLMSSLAWVGLIFLALRDNILQKILRLLIAFAAGSLLGGSFLHLIPETVKQTGSDIGRFVWVLAGFTLFLCMEQFLRWMGFDSVLEVIRENSDWDKLTLLKLRY